MPNYTNEDGTFNENGEIYFVECPFCGKHSNDTNTFWDEDIEKFICQCGNEMADGWELL